MNEAPRGDERARLDPTATVLLPSQDLDADLEFFLGIGFRLESIFPADEPRRAVVSGHGLRLSIECGAHHLAPTLRISAAAGDERQCIAPGGTRVEWGSDSEGHTLGPLTATLELCRASDAASWTSGRAGMQYRDLMPDRAGGHYIISHIEIPEGGEVPDYVHFHEIRVQLIYCLRGWVRVVYEDQGEAFVMEAGDCVLQPPEIRHRVLECSDGLEVLEISSPAQHVTRRDHDLVLPNSSVATDREFGGQHFLRHREAGATLVSGSWAGFEARDTGLEHATAGLARLWVRTAVESSQRVEEVQPWEFRYWYVRRGELRLRLDGEPEVLGAGDGLCLPRGTRIEVESRDASCVLLDFAQLQQGS